MPDITIVLANKNYSSWSLRGWLALELTGAKYDEVVIPLGEPDTQANIAPYSPSGKLPALIDGDIRVWESLAIVEYLADRFPDAGLWPVDRRARATARTICAEMHAGYGALRRDLPMNIRGHEPEATPSPAARADADRILGIWRACRRDFGRDGDFLFGPPSAADAFFAPVVSRFLTYSVPLDRMTEAYCRTIMAWEPMARWCESARAEPWVKPEYERGGV